MYCQLRDHRCDEKKPSCGNCLKANYECEREYYLCYDSIYPLSNITQHVHHQNPARGGLQQREWVANWLLTGLTHGYRGVQAYLMLTQLIPLLARLVWMCLTKTW